MGRRWVGLVMLMALVATGCGTRVTGRQAAAEAAQDARRSGLVVRQGTAADIATGDVSAGDLSAALPTGADTASLSGGLAAGAGGVGGGVAGSGGSRSAAPAGGNGGATDVGVTGTEIRVGNVSTLTGPVPGLFRGALIGTQAFMAYQNSRGGLYGRNIKVLAADDALDSGKNRAAHLQLKDQVFAFVGSFSVSDDGGASVLADCKCPDVGGALSRPRSDLPNNFDPQPSPPGWRTGIFNYFKTKYPPDVWQHVAFYVSAIESAREIAANERAVMEGLGYKVVYGREVQSNETNYTGDVIQMRNQGVKMLVWEGDVGNMSRLAKAMHDQNFSVTLPNWGGAIYDDNAFNIAGADGLEGSIIDNVYAMFRGEDAQRVPEVALFDQWMRRVDPNQVIDLFAFYGWISARLFVEAMQNVGAQPTRTKLLSTLGQMGTWDANHAIAPVNIGKKRPSDCWMVFRITKGQYVRDYPTDKLYECGTGGFVYR